MRVTAIAAASLVLLGAITIIPASTQAAPTISAAFGPFGFANQDNNYNAFATGNTVVMSHLTDGGNALVVEKSLNGGTSWDTLPTGGITVENNAMSIASNDDASVIIVLAHISSDIYAIRTTNGGATWTSTLIDGSGAPQSLGQTMQVDYADGAFIAVYALCLHTSCANSASFDLQYKLAKSTDNGATWAASMIYQFDAHPATNGGGMAIEMGSATDYTVYFATSVTPLTGGLSGMYVWRVTYTGGSSDWLQIKDAFNPGNIYGYGHVRVNEGILAVAGVGGSDMVGARQGTGGYFFSHISGGPLIKGMPFDCGNGRYVIINMGPSSTSFNIYYHDVTGPGTVQATSFHAPGIQVTYTAYRMGSDIHLVYGDSATGKFLIKKTTNGDCAAPPPPPSAPGPMAPAAERALTGVVGFDVDNLGNTVVVRTASGGTVKTLNGATLVDAGTTTTNCVRSEGVMAQWSFERSEDVIGYLHCSTTDPTDVSQVRLRAADLTSLELPGYCNDDCLENLNDEDLASPEDDLYEIRGVAGFPFDYSANIQDGRNSIFLAWAFSTDDGRIGVNTVTFNNVDQDVEFAPMKKIVGSGAPVDWLCTARDDNTRQDYVYGAQSQGQVAGFSVSYKIYNSQPRGLEPLMTSVFGGVETSRPDAIGCARDLVFVVQATGQAKVYRMQSTDVTIVSNAALNMKLGAASLDPSGSYGVYWAGDAFRFFQVANGTEVAAKTAPTLAAGETVVGFKLSDQGKSLYVATTNRVLRYDTAAIFETETIRPCYTCDRDADGIPDARDPDIDGDGLLNNEDPDIDGNGECNADESADLPPNTPGAKYGCKAGVETDDDGDGIPNTVDTSKHGPGGDLPPGQHVPCGVPNFPSCGNGESAGTGRKAPMSHGRQAVAFLIMSLIGLIGAAVLSKGNAIAMTVSVITMQGISAAVWSPIMWGVVALEVIAAIALAIWRAR